MEGLKKKIFTELTDLTLEHVLVVLQFALESHLQKHQPNKGKAI